MTLLILGLLLFLGGHSLRIVANSWRDRQVERLGALPWMALYSLVALAGFALLVHGYDAARAEPLLLWQPPPWTRHAAALLTLPVFVLLVAAYLPGTRIKATLGHPMVVAVKTWAIAHLLANGTLADVVLFGAFLVWAIVDYAAARRRDRATGTTYPVGGVWRDGVALVAGGAAWAAFALWLHEPLIGVHPFG